MKYKLNRIKNEISLTPVENLKNASKETVEALIADEEEAVIGYQNAIEEAKLKGDEVAVAEYQHIMQEEMEHIQELKDLLANNVNIEDGCDKNDNQLVLLSDEKLPLCDVCSNDDNCCKAQEIKDSLDAKEAYKKALSLQVGDGFEVVFSEEEKEETVYNFFQGIFNYEIDEDIVIVTDVPKALRIKRVAEGNSAEAFDFELVTTEYNVEYAKNIEDGKHSPVITKMEEFEKFGIEIIKTSKVDKDLEKAIELALDCNSSVWTNL